jgi:hypothetical protein
MLLLPAISLILDIPNFEQSYSEEDHCALLLVIWKRTLPVNLGSLIIQDWREISPSIVFRFHFLKESRPFWLFQFLTCDPGSA